MFTGWRNRERNRDEKKYSIFKKLAITTCLGLSFTFMTVHAEENDDLKSVYHVYIDGEHLGKVENEDVVKSVIDEKIAVDAGKFENLSLTIGEEVSIVPEKVFNPKFNNQKVTTALDEGITVMAKAVELTIDDETVGYFNDRQTAEKALTAFKEKYVDEEELEKIEAANEHSNKDIDEQQLVPNVGDTIITDIELSEEVSFSNGKAIPTEILNVKQGVEMLEKGTLEEKVHLVGEGEVLGEIASKYDLSTKKLLELNPSLDEDSLLQIDQEINVTEYKPFVDVIVNEEKMVEETINYETEVIESDELHKGDEKVKQEGKDGKKEIHYAIEKRNGKQTSKETLDENVTEEAVKKVIIKGTKVIPSRGTGDLSWPAVGGYVSSQMGERWGKMHKGIDIARPSNRTIKAADNGTVASAGYDSGGYGNKIVINHNNGMKTIYAHLSSISVKAGQTVEKGSKIGVMGSTGNSTGIHLHFEVYKDGARKNPMDYLN